MRRVVVTGIGAITPLGANAQNSWSGLIDGKSGIVTTRSFDPSRLSCRVSGEVSTDFQYEHYLSEKEARRVDKFIIYGLAAAVQAVEDSAWMPSEQHQLERTGVMIGSGIGGIQAIYDSSIALNTHGPRRISPFFIPSSLINLISGHVSIKYGFQGPNHSAVTACSTGAHAIGDAARIIADADADVMVAGGAEAAICELAVAGFASAKALSTNFNDTPSKASRPWDKAHDGFVMGEGAGVVVLEEYEHAKKRGAKIYGELVGYGLSGDGYHITSPHPEGRGAYSAMSMALAKSGLVAEDISYINAHGTSTPVGDGIELAAVQRIFSSCLDKVSMSSTKSSIGHLLGAAGSVEAIFSLMAMQENLLPATLNLDDPIDGCMIDLVPHLVKEKKINAVMTNSFGFGGTNSSLIFKRV